MHKTIMHKKYSLNVCLSILITNSLTLVKMLGNSMNVKYVFVVDYMFN